ncbi:MAG: CcmD family protein [Nitrospirota bacterium]|jgi:CcmD family protein
MENGIFLAAAYTVVWLGVSTYVYLSVRKQKRVEQKIELLEGRLPEE